MGLRMRNHGYFDLADSAGFVYYGIPALPGQSFTKANFLFFWPFLPSWRPELRKALAGKCFTFGHIRRASPGIADGIQGQAHSVETDRSFFYTIF